MSFFNKWSSFLAGLIFFITTFFTLSDYNINWDEPPHFARGQAYLHFFLTGNRNYKDLPGFDKFWEDVGNREKVSNLQRYSIYQNSRTMEHFLTYDNGHPPINGILAAVFNYIFYQKLGVMPDVESYHLFIIFISSILAGTLFYWVKKEYGIFAAIISFLALFLYPSFFAETHNNIKDPVETAFITFTLFFVAKALRDKKWKWAFLACVFAGLGLGTKLNILFVPFIIVFWFLGRYWDTVQKLKFNLLFRIKPNAAIMLFICFFMPIAIPFVAWPFLWQDPINNLLRIFEFYKNIGVGPINQPTYVFGGLNFYPLFWILFSTPIITLLLFSCGVLFVIINFKQEKYKLSFLALTWFLVTTGRISLSGFSIYGGGRQIMEFIPAMAILAGIGAVYIVKKLGNSTIQSIALKALIILMFLPIAIKLISIHPNQVAYFNPLIGGLSGAKEKNFPSWGMSLGNTYRQAVNWINANAQKEASVALVVSTGPNVPFILFRDDINYGNGFWSGNNKKGEYLVEEIFDNWMRVYYYPAEYADRILEPVYEVKVDNVAIAKVWKNDSVHTKPEFRNVVNIDENNFHWEKKEDSILISLSKEIRVTNIDVVYKSDSCFPIKGGSVRLSFDGKSWNELRQGISESYILEDKFYYPIAAYNTKFIELNLIANDKCDYSISKISLQGIL